MKFCGTCGAQVADEYTHCPNCGAPVVAAAAAQMQGGAQGRPAQGRPAQGRPAQGQARRPAAKKKPPKKGLIIGLCAALVAVIAIVVTIVVLTGRPSSFSVKDAVILTTEGFDGAGTLNMQLDSEELTRIVRAANEKLTKAQLSELLNSIKINVSEQQRNNLSNGQEVTISVSASTTLLDQLNMQLAEESWTYTVADLRPIEDIDPFAFVEVSFTGISPNLTAQITPQSVNSELGTLSYLVNGQESRVSGLAIGDTVTVSVGTDEARALERGYRFSVKEKSYTIDDNHDMYISSPDQLDEAALQRLVKEAQDMWTPKLLYSYANGAPGDVLAYDELVHAGTIVLIAKNGSSNWVDIILRAELRNSGNEEAAYQPLEQPVTMYFPVVFDNVIRYADGAVDFERIHFNRDISHGLHWGNSGHNGLDGYLDTTSMMTHLVRQWTADYEYALDPAMQEIF